MREVEAGLAPRIDYRLVADNLDADIVECSPSPAMLDGRKPVRVLRSLLSNIRDSFQVVRRIPDGSIIYSTGETWGLPASLAIRLLDKSCVHVVYAHRVYSAAWTQLLRRLRRLMRVDGWICVTNHQANLLRDAIGSDAPPVTAVSQGVDARFFDVDLACPLLGRKYILSVGSEMRNYSMLLGVAPNLGVQTLVKASSTWMNAMRGELQSLPGNVTLLTERLSYRQLRDLYANALLVVVPLYDTPQAAGITTILEAMAMQKCIVATRSSGLPDVLVHGRTGVIVQPDGRELASAIQELIANRQQRETLADAAKCAAVATASLEEHARQVTDILLTSNDRSKK